MIELKVSYDKSQDDTPVLILSRDTSGLFGSSAQVVNVITGDEATDLWNKLRGEKKS